MLKEKQVIGIFSISEFEVIEEPLDMAKILAGEGYKVELIAPVRKEFIERLHNLGLYIRRINLIRKNNTRFRSLEFLIKTLFCSLRKYDVLIGVDSVGFILAYLLYKLGKCRTLVYYALELSLAEEYRGHIALHLQNHFAKYADVVVTTGKDRARLMKEKMNLPTHPFVIENCPLYPGPQKKDGILKELLRNKGYDSEFIVIYQGCLHPDRCIKEMVHSVKMWGVNAVLVILGYTDKKFMVNLKHDIARNNLEDRIFYLGWFPGTRQNLLSLTSGADIGLGFCRWRNLNNSNATFWTPNKLYDYLACGMPVIFSDNPSLTFIQDEGLGLCVDAERPEEIAKAVNKLFNNKAYCERISETATTLFKEKYNYQVQIRHFLEKLKEVAK